MRIPGDGRKIILTVTKTECESRNLPWEGKHSDPSHGRILIVFYEDIMKGLSHIGIHKDEVAYASGHDKKVEDFVGAEILVPGVKNGEFQGIYDTAHRVQDSSGQKP